MRTIMFFTISLRRGGAERVICNLANELINNNKVIILLLDREISYKLDPRVKVERLCSIGDVKNSILKLLLMPYYSYNLLKYIRNNNIDTIYSFLLRANIIAILVKFIKKNTKIVISERSNPVAQYEEKTVSNSISKYLIRNIYPFANVITVNSYGSLTALRDFYNIKNKIEIIYNPINKDFETHNKEVVMKDVPFTFITVGRLDEGKNHVILLKAIKKLIEKGYGEFKVKIVGDGNLRSYLENFCLENSIMQYVEFLGQRSDIANLLKKSNVFIFVSKREGFPNVVLEALTAKIPVISTDCPFGPREIFTGQMVLPKTNNTFFDVTNNGILIPIDNIDLTVKAMEYLIVNYNNFTVDNKLLEKYKIDYIVKQFNSL